MLDNISKNALIQKKVAISTVFGINFSPTSILEGQISHLSSPSRMNLPATICVVIGAQAFILYFFRVPPKLHTILCHFYHIAHFYHVCIICHYEL